MTQGSRHFLIDEGYEEGIEFCQALLRSGEFSLPMLRRFGGTGSDKESVAAAVAEGLISGEVDADKLLLDFCSAPRFWLYLGLPQRDFEDPAQQSDSASFFTAFGKPKTWYGPVSSPDGKTTWMVHAATIKHFVASEAGGVKNYRQARVRWHVIAEIGETYVALHWNNFSRIDDESIGHLEQFEYWLYVPRILASLEALLGSSFDAPKLHTLVLDKLLTKYDGDPDFNWHHLRVRAEAEGIALSARTGAAKISEIDISGIRGFTRALAVAAANVFGKKADSDAVDKTEKAILRTLLHEWGTLSYEFLLERNDATPHSESDDDEADDDDDANTEVEAFRGHLYFGAKPEGKGPDQLPHCKCFKRFGGSAGARRFLLRHLEDDE